MVKPTQWKPYKFSAAAYEDYIDLPRLEGIETIIEKFHKRIDIATSKAITGALEEFRSSIDVSIHGTPDDDMKIILWDDNAIEEVMIFKLMDLIDEYASDEFGDAPPAVLKEQAEHLTRVADRIRSIAGEILSRADAPPKVTSVAVRPELAPEKSTQS